MATRRTGLAVGMAFIGMVVLSVAARAELVCQKCGQPPGAGHPGDHGFRPCLCRNEIVEEVAQSVNAEATFKISGKVTIESPDGTNVILEEQTMRTTWRYSIAGGQEANANLGTLFFSQESPVGGPFCPPSLSTFSRALAFREYNRLTKEMIAREKGVSVDSVDLAFKGTDPVFNLTTAFFWRCAKTSSVSRRNLLLFGFNETATWPRK